MKFQVIHLHSLLFLALQLQRVNEGATAQPPAPTRSQTIRCARACMLPGTPTSHAKGPEKRNGGGNGKNGASQPTNVKAVLVWQYGGMCKVPSRHQTQKHQTGKDGLGASHVGRY